MSDHSLIDAETETLEQAGNMVERVAYNRARNWNKAHISRLMLIAAELQRLSKIDDPADLPKG